MSIVTKKEVKQLKNRVSHCEYPKISRMQLMELIKTIEETMEVVGFYSAFNDSREMAENLYRQYEKED